jgi:hypothetical protein
MFRDTAGRSAFGRKPADDTSTGTRLALLAVLAGPTLLVAVLMGWRPLDGEQFAGLQRWWTSLTDRPRALEAAPPADRALADGWFFVTGEEGDAPRGYPVTDAEGLGFWTRFQALGGPGLLGRPLSPRFSHEGRSVQVFQRAVLRGDGAGGEVRVVPLLDDLHLAGHDAALAERWGIPALDLPLPAEPSPELRRERVEWLFRDHPPLAAYLAALPDVGGLLGFPTSAVHDVGSYYSVRFQRGALQLWKEEQPWARAGGVTAVNVGEIAVELGLYPSDVFAPITLAPPAGSGAS